MALLREKVSFNTLFWVSNRIDWVPYGSPGAVKVIVCGLPEKFSGKYSLWVWFPNATVDALVPVGILAIANVPEVISLAEWVWVEAAFPANALLITLFCTGLVDVELKAESIVTAAGILGLSVKSS